MKKKILIIVIILVLVIGLIYLGFNLKSPEDRFDELLKQISETKSVTIYGGVSASTEYLDYNGNKYRKFKTIDTETEVKEIIDILLKVQRYDGPIITKMPDYVIHLLDEFGNTLVKFTLNPFTSSIINTTLENTEALYDIIEKDKISYNCTYELDRYIQTENNELSSINAEEISKNPINFAKIIVTNNGWIYALIHTDNNKTIKDFDTYFNKNYKGYIKETLNDNFLLYVYNEQKSLDLNKINSCITIVDF